jgi:hypothetical protein
MKLKKDTLIVFFLSLAISFNLLLVERLFGIGWDYHSDSVYYINNSKDIINDIFYNYNHSSLLVWLKSNFFFNFIVYLLGSNIALVITLNIFLFSFTNILIYKFLKKNLNFNYLHLGTLILLFSPYRVHLSTTCLKDTLVIFLFASIFCSKFFIGSVATFFLITTRFFSLIYLFILFKNLKNRVLILFFFLFYLGGIFMYSHDFIFNYILEIHQADSHRVRDFDKIPAFENYGIGGILLRAIIWPILILTGSFILISPSLELFGVFLTSILNLLYCKIYLKSWGFRFIPFLILSIIALLVSSFTPFARYSLVILTILPLYIVKK